MDAVVIGWEATVDAGEHHLVVVLLGGVPYVCRAQAQPAQRRAAAAALEPQVAGAMPVGEHEGDAVRVVVREAVAAHAQGVDDTPHEAARGQVRDATSRDEDARQPLEEAVVDEAAEYGILFDDEDARRRNARVGEEAQRADSLGVARHLEDGAVPQRLHVVVANVLVAHVLWEQHDAAGHRPPRRGYHSERLSWARLATCRAHSRGDVEHSLIHLRRPTRKDSRCLETVPAQCEIESEVD